MGQLGLGTSTVVYSPTKIPFYNSINILDVLTAQAYVLALAANGSVYGGGLQFYGQYASGFTSTVPNKTPVFCPYLNTSLDISLPGTEGNANMKSNLLGWGNYAGYVQGKTTGSFSRILSSLPGYEFDGKVLSVNTVGEAVIVRLANGTVWVAGSNVSGRLGIGNNSNFTSYVFVEATFWRSVTLQQIFSSQSGHVCGQAANMSLYCWGQNTVGQLGVGDIGLHSTPTRVSFFDIGGYIVYKVAYGDVFTVVLTCGGRIFHFGSNSFGQLGNNIPDGDPHPTPVQVTSSSWNLVNPVDIMTGITSIFARTTDNNWYSWGAGGFGTLGTGSSSDSYSPKEIGLAGLSITRVKASSQSYNFFGWNDPSVNNVYSGCPVLINECLGANNCSSNGTCTDLERGYFCSCPSEWVGDGYATGTGCLNEGTCQYRGSMCVVNSTCDDSSGSAECSCDPGFEGDGTVNGTGCQDINECASGNPCANNAVCVNEVPGYTCECPVDFVGDPFNAGCVVQCPVGQYATNTTACSDCPEGTYTNTTGSTVCLPCAAGTYSNLVGSSSADNCSPCLTGGYSELGATYCGLCVHGYTNDPYVVNYDNTTCFPCDLGQYGYYGVCYDCQPGQYSVDPVAKQCTACPPGYYSTALGSLFCTACPAGTYSRGGVSSCTACNAGYYSPSASKDCLKCAPGTSTNGLTAQPNCTACSPGNFVSKSASQNCFACAPGTYSNTQGTAYCPRCPSGTFSSTSGATSCTQCGSGVASSTGSAQCQACAAGYVTADGITCAPCTAGTYYNTTTSTCNMCAAGTFVATIGTTSCFACSAGTFANSGSTYCARCPVNTYSNSATGFASCAACPSGTSSGGGAQTCS